MIDERSHSGLMAMRAGGGGGVSLGGRMGDSMPDYDNVKVSFVMQMPEKPTFPRSLYGVWGVSARYLRCQPKMVNNCFCYCTCHNAGCFGLPKG